MKLWVYLLCGLTLAFALASWYNVGVATDRDSSGMSQSSKQDAVRSNSIQSDEIVPSSPESSITAAGASHDGHSEKQAEWVLGDDNKRNALRAQLFSRISMLRDMSLGDPRERLASVVSELAQLARLLDSTNLPYAAANIGPPLRRPDGTRYSDQMLFSGMSPETVKNADQKQAYLALIEQRGDKIRKRNWLLQAKTDHQSLVRLLDDVTRELARSGVLSEDARNRAMEAVQRQADENSPLR